MARKRKEVTCIHCEVEFIPAPKKPGKHNECEECANDVDMYTGNMIYDHKVGATIQINSDPRLTEYINGATKLRNKGSNLGNNPKVDSSMAKSSGLVKSAGERARRRD